MIEAKGGLASRENSYALFALGVLVAVLGVAVLLILAVSRLA